MADLYIGVGSIPIHCQSMKGGLKKAYDYVKDHPKTKAHIIVIDGKRGYSVGNFYVNRKKTPVAWMDQLKIHILKSDGTLGKILVRDGKKYGYLNYTTA